MSVIQWINFGLAVVLIAIVVVRTFWGLKNGLFKALIRLAGSVTALVLTFLSFKVVFEIFNPLIEGLVDKYLASMESGSDISSVASCMGSVMVMLQGLFGPLIFMGLFLCWNGIMEVVSKIIRAILKIIPIKAGLTSRILGTAVSVLSGIFVFVLVLMPFAGYAKEAPKVYNELIATGSVDENQTVTDVVSEIETEGLFMGGVTKALTSSAFDFSSQVETDDGVKFNSFDEIHSVIAIIPEVTALKDLDFSDLSNVDLTSVDALIDKIGESAFLKTFVSDVLSTAGTAWKNNETFLGINLKQQIEESMPGYGNAIDGILDKLAGCNYGNVVTVGKEFTSAVKSLAKMASYVNGFGNVQNSSDLNDLGNNLADILTDLDPSTVEMILPAVKPEVFENSGLAPNEAQLVSEVLTETLTSVSEMTDEEKAVEANAINTVMSYATSSTATPDAEEVIDALVSSNIILPAVQSVAENKADETNELLSNVSEEQKSAISDAITDYESKNPDADAEKLNALKALFGLE